MTALLSKAGRDEFRAFLAACRAQKIRSIQDFCRDDIVIPEGKFEGQRWRYDVQPWTRLFHEAIDSGRWNRVALTGCVQGGKSLVGYAIPTARHLFDYGEAVAFGAPTVDIGKAKFRNEVLPLILKRKAWRRLLPRDGAGSQGGVPEEIHFRNGAKLRFFGSHGGDETRSSWTARVLVATECDKMDTAGVASREASPIRQMEARLASYDEDQRRVYLECTLSVPEGCINQEITHGTNSRLLVQCPGCRLWCTPERENLHAVREAESIFEARREGCWVCPGCGMIWEEEIRVAMNLGARLVHEGQEIDAEGQLHGEPKETDTLGFRFNAFNNLFWRTSTIAAAEWRTLYATEDEDEAEREALQFRWVRPYQPPILDTTPLDPDKLRKRVHRGLPRGLLPEDTARLTIGVDLGKWVGWYVVNAWRPGPRAHVPDYGTIEVPSKDLPVELALLAALREFRDRLEGTGFLLPSGETRRPDQVWIDARYQGEDRQPEAVYQFCREAGSRYRPALGFGSADRHGRQYAQPTEVQGKTVYIGDQYHIDWESEARIHVVKLNADAWKSRLHERLSLPWNCDEREEPPVGSMTLYESPDANEHRSFVKHLTSEKQSGEIIPGRGRVVKWVHVRGANHYLDAASLAGAAAHFAGVRFIRRPARPVVKTIGTRALKLPADYPLGRRN